MALEIDILGMLKIKPFRQTPGLCGPASLKMVLEYWDISVSEKEIAQKAGSSKEKGTGKEGLVRAAKHFGLNAFAREKSSLGDLGRFIKKGIPVIVDWFSEDEGHYSVVVDINEKKIVLMDPSLKKAREFLLHNFQRVWFDFPGRFIRNPQDLILRLIIVAKPYGK